MGLFSLNSYEHLINKIVENYTTKQFLIEAAESFYIYNCRHKRDIEFESS